MSLEKIYLTDNSRERQKMSSHIVIEPRLSKCTLYLDSFFVGKAMGRNSAQCHHVEIFVTEIIATKKMNFVSFRKRLVVSEM